MPKFTIEDVDKQIEAIRAKYRQPKPQVPGSDLLTKFRESVKKRKAGTIPPPIETREIQ